MADQPRRPQPIIGPLARVLAGLAFTMVLAVWLGLAVRVFRWAAGW